MIVPRYQVVISTVAATLFFGGTSLLSQEPKDVTPKASSEAPAQKDPAPEEKKELSAALKKKIEEYTKFWEETISDPRKKAEIKRLDGLVDEIKEAVELTDEEASKLKEAAKKAVDASHPGWLKAGRKYMRESWTNRSNLKEDTIQRARESLSRMSESSLIRSAGSIAIQNPAIPEEQDSWKEALQEILSDEQSKAWTEKLAEKKKERENQMKTVVERWEMRQAPLLKAQLDPAVKKLKDTIPFDKDREARLLRLAERTVADAIKAAGKTYREAVQNLAPSQRELLFKGRLSVGSSVPENLENSAPWVAGLKELLSEVEYKRWEVAWEQHREKEEKRLAKMADEVIKGRAASMREQQATQLDPIVTDILDTLGLNDADEKKLEGLLEKALDAYEDSWKKSAHDYLDGLSEQQREQTIQRGYVSVSTTEEMLPMNQEVWKEGLEKLLDPEQVKRWESTKEDRQKRRRESFGNVILLKLDDVLGLSDEQRKNILPILAELGEERYLRSYRNRAFSISSSTIYQLFRNDSDQERLAKYLDEDQKKRWSIWVKARVNQYRTTPITRTSKSPEPRSDAAYIEEAISTFLYQTIGKKREEYVNYQMAKLDDIDRAVNLTEEQKTHLALAAKGMCEVEIDNIAEERNSWVRNSVGSSTTRAKIYDRLTQLSSTRFGNEAPKQNSIWTAAIDHVLTEEQRKKWDVVQKERKNFENDVIKQRLLTQAEVTLHLTSEQIQEMGEIFEKMLVEYAPDLERSYTSSTPWYYNSYYSLSFVEGIPEKQRKELLSERQFELWEKKHSPRMKSYWSRIENYHNERTGKKNEDAEDENEGEAEKKAAAAAIGKVLKIEAGVGKIQLKVEPKNLQQPKELKEKEEE
ncbi:MAG: hypothetical protein HKN23_05150 [Verrucomicrobiales bacterium]|nr:hypothetical protein [Verrucomicrobiales bacterium]